MNGHASCYVYYRVPGQHTAAARRAVMALFSDLQAQAGIAGRLARRRDDPQTWMEIYDHIADPDRFEASLRRLADHHGLSALLAPDSNRVTEVFVTDALVPGGMDGSNTACA